MKNKVFFCIALAFIGSSTYQAQVSFGGKQTIEGNSTIVDFNSDPSGNKVVGTGPNTNGFILSAVENKSTAISSANSSDNNGTFLFDKSDSRVWMYQNNTWVSLSDPNVPGTNPANANLINTSEETSGMVKIGENSSSAAGVFVLESPGKAMILPRINTPHINVKSPYPGMICYDTASKSLAVFDGTNWNYWK